MHSLYYGRVQENGRLNWIGHILRRNCLLKQVIEGKIKGEMGVTRRRGRRRRKLLDDIKYRRGYSHLKEEALDRIMWRNRFGGGFGPVVRQPTEYCIQCTRIISTEMKMFGLRRRVLSYSTKKTVMNFVLFVPCIMIQLCNVKRQNALLMF